MRTVAVSAPMFPEVEKRFVEEAVVAKEFVVVANVVVAFPVTNVVEKRFVEDAVVANDEVEVAFVVVELRPVKF